jgi:hypothetical protein
VAIELINNLEDTGAENDTLAELNTFHGERSARTQGARDPSR